MHVIGKKITPINIIVHYPKTEQGRKELAERVAEVHADFVSQYIQKLSCPSKQKNELISKIIKTVKNKREAEEQTK